MNVGDRRVGVEHPRCPYCHEAVVPGEEGKQSCNACMAWHHAECWDLHGGCSACNRDRPVRARPPASSKEAAPDRTRRRIVAGAAGAFVLAAALGAAALVPSRPGKAWLVRMLDAKTEVEKTAACREGALAGDPAAMNYYGFRLASGLGCERDDAQAVEWGKRAADGGQVEACYGVGAMYESGRGVPQSDEQAALWYRRAVAGGDTVAAERLALLIQRRPDLR